MPIKFKNNAKAELVAGINTTATSLTVKAGQGDRFPEVSGSDYFYLTLVDSSGNREIVKCTSRSSGSDSMTIVRAQEGTTARSFSANDKVELRLTAGTLSQIITDISSLFDSDTTLQGNLNAHKTSGDHDSRYFTQTETTTNYYSKTNLQTSGQAQVHANNLTNRTSISHSEITDNEPAKHRLINDSGTGTTELWSASKIDSVRANLQTQINGKANTSHTHDDRYYTETEIDTMLSGIAVEGHTHDDRYYTKTNLQTSGQAQVHAGNLTSRSSISHSQITDDEPAKHRLINDSGTGTTELWSASKINTSLAAKSNEGHTHDDRYYRQEYTYTQAQVEDRAAYHAIYTYHDDRYYTEWEINSILNGYSTTSHSHSGLNTPVMMCSHDPNAPTMTEYGIIGKARLYFPVGVNRVSFTAYANSSGMTSRLRVLVDGTMVSYIDFQHNSYYWKDQTSVISVGSGFHEVIFEFAYVSGGGSKGVSTSGWSVVFFNS